MQKNTTIDMNKIIPLKRTIEIDTTELKNFLSTCIPVQDPNNETVNPILGKDGEYIWCDKNVIPEEIRVIINQCKDMFQLKDNIKNNIVRIYHPSTCIGKDITKIERTAMNVGSRIIICSGHREVFDIFVSAAGFKANSPYSCVNNDAFQLGMGSAQGVDISFDNKSWADGPERKGFRNTKIKKDPTKRYVIVVDSTVEEQALVNEITKETNKLKISNKIDDDVEQLLNF